MPKPDKLDRRIDAFERLYRVTDEQRQRMADAVELDLKEGKGKMTLEQAYEVAMFMGLVDLVMKNKA